MSIGQENNGAGSFGRRVAVQHLSLSPESLLLIVLDDLGRAHFRFIRIKTDIAESTSLAQEVPALIQFDLDLREPLTVGFVEKSCPV